ncbi:hypothetical protein SAMN05444008_11444 [Cnuella takakiae]|uniref:Uncharacterized protein n=1 Tax=Cnuella takakiae TaxID=1302690 RepID=A0A1M5FK74_9BACT|nr:hypothetical protein SAMN05444008_11444 [Cnuella takakiae]
MDNYCNLKLPFLLPENNPLAATATLPLFLRQIPILEPTFSSCCFMDFRMACRTGAGPTDFTYNC